MPQERQGTEQVGEAKLQEAVWRVRAGRGGAQGRDGVQLQLQVPLVLRGEVRPVQEDGDQVLLREEGRRPEGKEGECRQPQEEHPAEEEALSKHLMHIHRFVFWGNLGSICVCFTEHFLLSILC